MKNKDFVKLTKQFIDRSNLVHNYFYSYSKTIYKNKRTPVIITCPVHGDFLQNPESHYNGRGCRRCFIDSITFSREEFISKSTLIYGNKFDYSKFIYTNDHTESVIICPDHGEFLQTPVCHWKSKTGCPKCGVISSAKTRTFSKEDFIKEANIIHNNKYNYCKFIYINDKVKGIIICSLHGEFMQDPSHHKRGHGCPKCAGQVRTHISSKEIFVLEANKIHNNRFDYSKFIFINLGTKGIIICPDHGEFIQVGARHLDGFGCYFCSGYRSNKEMFIQEANIIHSNKYDYSIFEYLGNHIRGTIICSTHGPFQQTPANHKQGMGCPACGYNISKLETMWLNYIGVPSMYHNQKIIIDDIVYKVDAFDPETNTIYEFYGDYWHGNPARFAHNDVNKRNKQAFGLLYNNTIEREQKLKNAGFNIIVIWESDWKKLLNSKQ